MKIQGSRWECDDFARTLPTLSTRFGSNASLPVARKKSNLSARVVRLSPFRMLTSTGGLISLFQAQKFPSLSIKVTKASRTIS